MPLLRACLLLSLLCSSLLAATIRVPQDQPTIQAGIDAAVNGDTVLVGPGVYSTPIYISNKSVSLMAADIGDTSHIAAPDTAIRIVDCPATVNIRGFQFEGPATCAISVNNTDSIHIELCQFRSISGDEINCFGSNAVIRECKFFHSAAIDFCIWGVNAKLHISRNVFSGGYPQPAVFADDNTICELINNTFYDCWAGTSFQSGSTGNVRNNIFYDLDHYAVHAGSEESLVVHYNDFFLNGTDVVAPAALGFGNLFADASFDSASPLQFALSSSSPCIDAGDPDPIYNDPDGSRNDIGAFPFVSPDTKREVPSEYPSIQAAINAASNGDTVLVDDGHYYERITYLGKKITVASKYLIDSDTSHIAQTIIDGDTSFVPMIADTGCVVRFVNGEDSTAMLSGFTVRNGTGADTLGSGVVCVGSFPRIFNCHITGNDFAGIYMTNVMSGPTGGAQVVSCDIDSNRGCGVFVKRAIKPAFSHCRIDHNQTHGIYSFGSSPRIEVDHCLISNNVGIGIHAVDVAFVTNTTIEFNEVGIGFVSTLDKVAKLPKPSFERDFIRLLRNDTIRNNGFGLQILAPVWTVDSCLFEDNFNYGISILEEGRLYVSNSVFRRNGNPNSFGGAVDLGSLAHDEASFTNTLFDGNVAEMGGALACSKTRQYVLDNCTFVNNHAYLGSAIYQYGNVQPDELLVSECIFASNHGGPVISRADENPEDTVTFPIALIATCTNIYGNEGGDWIDTLSVQLGVNGNISADPLFCDTAASNYTIRSSSPCAPANDSCGVLIGAYGVGCENAAPTLTSSESVNAYAGLPFRYQATATDADGPSLSFAFLNLPTWLSANSDSAYGIPPLTDIDTSLLVIVSDGFLADSQIVTIKLTETPLLSGPLVEGDSLALHVVSHTPVISWRYDDSIGGYSQTHYEVAVGSDSNWSHAELWNPAVFAGEDSSIVYAGAALTDGQTYWLRVRAKNDLLWSNWKQTAFRLNSIPSVPTPLSPIGDVAVNSAQPTFVIRNSSDAENDSLRYIFEIAGDSMMTGAHVFEKAADADSITSAQIDIALDENVRYFWRVRASDYFEESAFSPVGSFWVNVANTAPSPFDLMSPPNTMSPPLSSKSPTLDWTTASDPDPLDQVQYTLYLATDANFNFVHEIPDLGSSHYVPTDALERGRHYWWKVRALDLHDGETWSTQIYRFRTMTLGDANGSGAVSISDAVHLIGYIFGGGPAPDPLASGDANCNGSVSISDVVYLINYIFGGGPAPCEHPNWR